MAFDPKEFLRATSSGATGPKKRRGFDPQEFLAATAPPVEERPAISPVGPYRDGFKPPAPEPSVPASLEKPRTPTQIEAAARGVGQGVTFGFADELAGAGRSIKNWFRTDRDPEIIESYREGRDEYRAADKAAQDAHPLTFGAAEIGSGLLMPLGAAKGAKAVWRGIKQGAAYGFGSSEADVTKGEVARAVEDTVKGGALGGAVAAGGELVGKAVKKGAELVTGGLRRRILNEVAEGTAATTPTARKWLNKAGEAIHDEVVHGPDGSKVRAAYKSGALEGQEKLKPIIEKVGAQNDAAYEAFEKAGKSEVSVAWYNKMLEKERIEAINNGQSLFADGIRALQEKVYRNAEDAGRLTLTQLRGLTTEAQGIASGVVNSLTPNERSKVLRQVAAVATESMNKALQKQAGKSAELAKAAEEIGKRNRRMFALLTMDDALKLRAHKEATGKGLLLRAAERVSNPATLGAVAGGASALESGDAEKIAKRALIGAAAMSAGKAIPGAVRVGDHLLTSAAIRSAQGRPVIPMSLAERLARATGRSGAGVLARKRSRDEQEEGQE